MDCLGAACDPWDGGPTPGQGAGPCGTSLLMDLSFLTCDVGLPTLLTFRTGMRTRRMLRSRCRLGSGVETSGRSRDRLRSVEMQEGVLGLQKAPGFSPPAAAGMDLAGVVPSGACQRDGCSVTSLVRGI